jgi:hypothetical protein
MIKLPISSQSQHKSTIGRITHLPWAARLNAHFSVEQQRNERVFARRILHDRTFQEGLYPTQLYQPDKMLFGQPTLQLYLREEQNSALRRCRTDFVPDFVTVRTMFRTVFRTVFRTDLEPVSYRVTAGEKLARSRTLTCATLKHGSRGRMKNIGRK